MNGFPAFAAWATAMTFLVWACTAAWRSVCRHLDRLAIARLAAREAALKAEVARQRERRYELTTARDFADSQRSGYVDRTGLEAS